MADKRSLKQQMNHFLSVYGQNIRNTGEAIIDGRWEAFDSLVKTVSESKLTISISDTLTSSSQSQASFLNIVGDLSGDEFAARAVKALVAGAVGGLLIAGSGAVGGVAGLALVVIGAVLILWGIAQLLPRIFEAAKEELLQHLSQLTN